jgi:hypothetical protein
MRFLQVCVRVGERAHCRIRCRAFRLQRRNRGGVYNTISVWNVHSQRVFDGLQGVTGGEALNHISPNMVVQVSHLGDSVPCVCDHSVFVFAGWQ